MLQFKTPMVVSGAKLNILKKYVDIFINITYIFIPWNLFTKFEPITVRLTVV